MAITITEFAEEKISEIMSRSDSQESYLRIGLRSGGCSGFSYDFDFVSEPLEDDKIFSFDKLKICIERKASVVEFANNVGHDQARFLREIERMSTFPYKFIILEFSLSDLMNFPVGSDIPEKDWSKLKITNKFMLKMLMDFQINHGIHVLFCGSKKNAKWTVLSILKRINEKYSTEGN